MHTLTIHSITALLLGFLAGLFLALASPVSAHSVTPISASPAAGAVLPQSPSQVYLTFPEEAGEKGSFVQVFDQQGKQVDLGNGGVDLNDPRHAGLGVKLPSLAQGVYLVKWKIALSDQDFSQGQYYFGVGSVTLPKDPPPAAVSADAAPAASAGQPALIWTVAALVLVAVAAAIVIFSKKAASRQ